MCVRFLLYTRHDACACQRVLQCSPSVACTSTSSRCNTCCSSASGWMRETHLSAATRRRALTSPSHPAGGSAQGAQVGRKTETFSPCLCFAPINPTRGFHRAAPDCHAQEERNPRGRPINCSPPPPPPPPSVPPHIFVWVCLCLG